MAHVIKELFVDGLPAEYDFEAEGDQRLLGPLTKINLFVGPNNSGKSRLLRELSKLHQPKFVPDFDMEQLRRIRNNFQVRITGFFNQQHVIEAAGYKAAVEGLPDYKAIQADRDDLASIADLAKRASSQINDGFTVQSSGYGRDNRAALATGIKEIGDEMVRELAPYEGMLRRKWHFERLYVPALRGLRTFQAEGDCYGERTANDYFKGKTENPPSVFTGLNLYGRVRSLLLGNLQERDVVAKLQVFLSENFFARKPVAIIPRVDDVLHVKIGDEREQPIFNLGDGIQMIIAIVFPLFLFGDKYFLAFIEEPELFLHPGLQRTLVRTLASFPNGQFFLATHSNHILDLTMDRTDISVFSLHKELDGEGVERGAKFKVESVQGSKVGVLNSLGVRNSSVFLSNCTIWVEGITDRRYFRRFLKLYALNKLGLSEVEEHLLPFKEDMHYSFVEYAGSNITHWSFLDETDDAMVVDRLCGRLMLIADKDSSPSKDARHEKLAQRLGDYYVCLPRREVENLLSPKVIRGVVSSYEGDGVALNEFSYESYEKTYLGEFIEAKVLSEPKRRKGSYASDSGTVSNKLEFCSRALTGLTAYGDLSADAVELARRIYDFISQHNPE